MQPTVKKLRELSERFSGEGEYTIGAAIDETCEEFGIKQNPWLAVDYSHMLAYIADAIESEQTTMQRVKRDRYADEYECQICYGHTWVPFGSKPEYCCHCGAKVVYK